MLQTMRVFQGEYSCLRTELILRREYSYYLLQLYIPSFMLVIVSWVAFWLDKDSVPARVSLSITTLLTMTTQASGINAKLPPVSYTKSIDVWIGVCLAFIFGALLEYAFVNYAGRLEAMAKEKNKKKASLLPPPQPLLSPPTHGASAIPAIPPRFPGDQIVACPQCDAEQGENSVVKPLMTSSPLKLGGAASRMFKGPRARKMSCIQLWLSKYKERSKRIDVVSRLVFPVGFFFFNCVYWTAYMA